MSRTIGSGALSAEIQQEILRAFTARKDSTIPALAKKHNVSESIIKGVLYRLRKRTRVVLESQNLPPA
jgi:hypothetical protein